MEEKITKKQIIPLVIGVLTLVVLVVSATYAYFSVTSGRNAGTTTITGDIGGDTIGTVTLSGGNANLYLGITTQDMSLTNQGTTYYSSTTEGSRETSLDDAGKATYTATLTGDNSLTYACDYEFTVTSTGTMVGKQSFNDLVMVFEGDIEKTINLTGTDKVSGTWYGINGSDVDRSFNAYLQFTNTESIQNDLAGTNLSVQLENTNWNCYLSEDSEEVELVGEAYALFINDGLGMGRLVFKRSETPITTSDTYEESTISNVYDGIETTTYSDSTSVPWGSIVNFYGVNTLDIIFEDTIKPISTANWFNFGQSIIVSGDFSRLDTSNVTNMSSMFSMTSIEQISGLENWDTSSVTNMSSMFSGVFVKTNLNINNWNVSNVTDMSSMFLGSTLSVNLDLSGWNVSSGINYENFAQYIGGTGTLTQPNWPTA